MFFSRIALLALPAIVAANAYPRDNTCVVGSSQFCCNSLQDASSFSASDKKFLGLFGANVDNVIGQVGLACNPVDLAGAFAGGAVAAGSSGCNQQNACCQDTQANGFVAINCTPVTGNA